MSERRRSGGYAWRVPFSLAALGAAIVAVVGGCAQKAPVPAPEPAPPAARPVAPPVAKPAPRVEAPARTWEQYRLRVGQRIAEVNAAGVYLDTPPDILLAIPVLEIELNADGSVRRIEVLRYPRQAKDTTQLAIDAVRRAGPFGSVAHLPKPWRFPETFLFRDDRRFKPRSLD
ncbi:hypothetical protein M8A51_12805 [Schlegelella sp. S2-27]|uniref:TonB C-terminal domain-containing protein n=1 Tax=Caldimonas mangrovi TaxID=2944811 RepID=A0ABT0YNV4_9BURK|nr:hypothetical protein [Caldimonas mangrovi]MCM5680410.1 hypothetical protein [Caldimonas mangrovi]